MIKLKTIILSTLLLSSSLPAWSLSINCPSSSAIIHELSSSTVDHFFNDNGVYAAVWTNRNFDSIFTWGFVIKNVSAKSSDEARTKIFTALNTLSNDPKEENQFGQCVYSIGYGYQAYAASVIIVD